MGYKITDHDQLYRRIPHNKPDCWKEINGIKVLSSFNFKTRPKEDGLSVNIAKLIKPDEIVERFPKNDVAEFPASVPIGEGYNCIQTGKDESHAIIEGDTKPIAKKLAKAVTKVFKFLLRILQINF